MKIYTKSGDQGETSYFGGERVPKDSLRIETYGTADELNSIIGVCRSLNTVQQIDSILDTIQHDLFTLGADLATPGDSATRTKTQITLSAVSRLEQIIDGLEPQLEPLRNFIVPGGSRTAAMLHVARTVCRRAERFVVRLSHEEPINRNSIVYLNRLSDVLFVLARWANTLSNTEEKKWKSG